MQKKKFNASLIFALTLIFYLYTLLPSLAWGDGAKLQSEAVSGESFILAELPAEEFSPDGFIFSRVGVAAWDHPLYIILGRSLVQFFPWVDSLWLVNLISAVFGAASVALVYLIVYRYTRSLLASGYASLSLAVSHTFWWHASTPEVYTLFVFLLLVSFYFFDSFESSGRLIYLVFSLFFLGLAASNHILAFLAIPAMGFYLFLFRRPRGLRFIDLKKFIFPSLGFLPGFSLYLIQFARLSVKFPISEIMGPVIGSTFLSQLGTFSPVLLGESLLSYLLFLAGQFGPIGMLLGLIGFRKVFEARESTLRKTVSFFIVFALFGIFYRVTDQFTFFIPSYIFWAMFLGIGTHYALGLIPGRWRNLFLVILGTWLVATPFFYTSLPGLAEKQGLSDASIGIPEIGTGVRDGLAYYMNPDKRGDFSAFEFGRQTVSNLPYGSLVIAEWYTDTDEYFILRYFTKIEKLRPDVTVVGWPTTDPFTFDSRLVMDAISDSFPEHPVYLASLSDKFYSASKLVELYCILPENNLYRLYPGGDGGRHCLGIDSVTE